MLYPIRKKYLLLEKTAMLSFLLYADIYCLVYANMTDGNDFMNERAFFHDMTLDYLRPAEPDKNRKTLVRFRSRKGDALNVVLVW